MSDVAVVLTQLKYSENGNAALRALANFGASRLHWTGTRVLDLAKNPRPKRARDRQDDFELPSGLRWSRERDDVLDRLKREGYTLVAVEITPTAQSIDDFKHPERAAYVFGPEDGNLDPKLLGKCAHTVKIPSNGCFNVAVSVALTLHDRAQKERKKAKKLRRAA